MPFVNPFSGKVTVLTEHLDFYQWPCISGESFPPTFTPGSTGIVAYATQTTYPTVRVDQPATAGVTSSRAQWPALPLSSPRTGVFAGCTLAWKFYIATLQVNNAKFGLQLSSDGLNKIEFNTTWANDGIRTTMGGVGVGGDGTGNLGACPALNTWHDLTMILSADGRSLTFTLDGATLVTRTSGSSVATFPPTPVAISTNGASFAVDAHVTQIELSWS